MRHFLKLLLGGLLVSTGVPARALGEPVTVFAAASLTSAFEEIGRAYHRKTGIRIRFSFASSSVLARQIEAGAPADVFASAHVRWMDRLADKGLIETDTRRSPVGNSLVLIAPSANPVKKLDLTARPSLAAALGADGRLAIGDPDHVPAGIYARRALAKLGLWRSVAHRLVRSDNVRAALVLVERGEVPLGIVYATDAKLSSRVKVVAHFAPHLHGPIRYPIAVLKGQGDARVQSFHSFLSSQAGLTIFVRHGFVRAGPS